MLPQKCFDAVYMCEDVSSIEFKDGIFYLVDDFGTFQIKRAMRPSTFLKCVMGAYQLAKRWEGGQISADICKLRP